eukprot:Plantae.Rhodophyta-Hildenbrandia_rubra.ctg61331.p1 GENE.Plantae.Rhodophyta-Hildenbrandia_rubra.ctg61331~~Plantae.Rhodophyta-Hildenbrandia_rubra.ctg61331.p1  ORF type:complete len:419 (+),score=4.52 Plantae.Rhodophyta-Hildenbrandia_rubra.ctg61331:130-1386(+)
MLKFKVMINIKFTQQNVLYHVFNIDMLSLSVNNNLSDLILDLKNPQIIYDSYENIIHEQKLSTSSLTHSIQSDYNDISTTVKQKPFNHVVATESLLYNSQETRQKKRGNIKNDIYRSISSIENVSNPSATLIEPTNVHHDKVIDEKIIGLSNPTDAQNNSSSTIIINHPITVSELSQLIALHESEIIKFLFLKGINVTINQIISVDIATSIAVNYGFSVTNNDYATHEVMSNLKSVVIGATEPRVPILTIVGDINHGKTFLAEIIQNNQVPNKQTSSITQKIKAYETHLHLDNITQKAIILDTPGHGAFIAMRSLGLKIANLVILAIDANIGLSFQGIQIIKDIINKQVPIVIALTKIDTVTTDIDILKQNIINHDVIPQDLKNDIPIVPVSSVTGKNINVLLSNIITLVKKQELEAT